MAFCSTFVSSKIAQAFGRFALGHFRTSACITIVHKTNFILFLLLNFLHLFNSSCHHLFQYQLHSQFTMWICYFSKLSFNLKLYQKLSKRGCPPPSKEKTNKTKIKSSNILYLKIVQVQEIMKTSWGRAVPSSV